MTKKVLVPIAHGSEEIEAVTIIDTLRRAKLNVVVASVEHTKEIECSRGVKIVADGFLDDYLNVTFDCIAIPGGLKGSETFAKTESLVHLLQKQLREERLLGSICASPAVVLARNNLLKRPHSHSHHQHGEYYLATSYPSFQKELPHPSNDRVVIDGNLITSQGPGTSLEFSAALIDYLLGSEVSNSVTSSMLLRE